MGIEPEKAEEEEEENILETKGGYRRGGGDQQFCGNSETAISGRNERRKRGVEEKGIGGSKEKNRKF